MKSYYFTQETKIGPLTIRVEEDAICQLEFGKTAFADSEFYKNELLARVFAELDEYLAGKRLQFMLPLRPVGTEFQKRVWQELLKIPYGETRSYQQIAAGAGNEKACRAVGMANHNNPIAILIPCHRVVGKNGTLTGYAGGLEIKQRLLELEKNSNVFIQSGDNK